MYSDASIHKVLQYALSIAFTCRAAVDLGGKLYVRLSCLPTTCICPVFKAADYRSTLLSLTLCCHGLVSVSVQAVPLHALMLISWSLRVEARPTTRAKGGRQSLTTTMHSTMSSICWTAKMAMMNLVKRLLLLLLGHPNLSDIISRMGQPMDTHRRMTRIQLQLARLHLSCREKSAKRTA